jgi:nitrogenase molybdenum-iron protein NifN
MTMEHCDRFIHQLKIISGREVPAWIERQRGQLQDAMIDCHMWLQDARLALAAEGDLLAGWCDFARSQGMLPAPLSRRSASRVCNSFPLKKWSLAIWKICRIYSAICPPTCWSPILMRQTWPTNSPFRLSAPVFPSSTGLAFRRVRQGYPGMRDTLFELANLMRERHHHLPLYHSPLRQQFARDTDGGRYATC